MTTQTALTAIPQLPTEYSAETLKELFAKIESEVSAEVPDVETKEGRARIKSLAAKVSSSKTAIDKPIRDYLREIKAFPKVLEKNARESVERFDALRDSILEPLRKAQAEQDEKIERMNAMAAACSAPESTADSLGELLNELAKINVADFWPELQKKARTAMQTAETCLDAAIDRLQREEAQAAELEKLRKEVAEREQAERDRKIAEEAAERARQVEQLRAQQEREAVERRAVEAKQREEAQRMEAERAKRAAAEAEKRMAEAEKLAKENAERELIEAQKRAELAAKQAAEQERQRIEEEQKRAENEAKAREADKAHRIKINRAALCALIAEGISEEDGKKVITAIAKGLVPNVRIYY